MHGETLKLITLVFRALVAEYLGLPSFMLTLLLLLLLLLL